MNILSSIINFRLVIQIDIIRAIWFCGFAVTENSRIPEL